ncbi:MAG: ABC transporter substrate-binding protein [Treponema sp.]|jgi:peptide/nickel transport system substrate-binding protein|nr:ABC transporter substrate-binding protein [Treponema sp.]
MKKIILLTCVSALLVLACKGGSGETTSNAQGAGAAREAPEFVQLVAEGKLPPLAERLPKNPRVITPYEKVGVYGGDWRVAQVGGHLAHVHRYQYYEKLVNWTPGWGGIVPNVAESYEVSPDSREYTFHLREGMKWSDGHPFSADDVEYWFVDVVSNPQLTPSPNVKYRQGNELMKFEKIDQYTFKFIFPNPNGLFLQQLAQTGTLDCQYVPKHYYSQFHIKYNPEADNQAKAAGYPDWVAWTQAKGGVPEPDDVIYQNGERPVINAWMWEIAPGVGSASQAIAVRNPYYWKVDTEGNQLPYINRIVYDLLQDVEVLILKILNGEIDWMDQYFALPNNKAIIYENQEKGGYHLFETTPTEPNVAIIQFNLNHPDPTQRALFSNKDFRIGVSHAINRQEIIDIIYSGQGTPAQAAPRPGTEFYNEKLATQYIEYDVAAANAALDRAGLTGRDSAGFRLRPDGKRVAFTFELDVGRTEFVEMVQLLQNYLRAVGVDAQVRTMDRSLWEIRVRRNWEFDATIHRFGGGVGQAVLIDPRYYFPLNGNSVYAPAWQVWYNNPTGVGSTMKPEEPPSEVKRSMDIYNEIKRTGDTEEQIKLMQQILEIAADQFYTIGILWDANGYGIVKNNFKNVPPVMPFSWEYPHPGPENPCQFYIDPAIK